MSEANTLRKEYVLGDRLSQLSPEEFVALIEGLCLALEEPNTPFHGQINTGNVSLDPDGSVGLGAPLTEEKPRYTADQIEYIAPEVFWNDIRSPRADIFSIGMMIYAWANGGCLPFLYPNATASDRAEALRRRMSGEAFLKKTFSSNLKRIIRKSTAFKPEDRYTTVAALHEDFRNFAAEVEKDSASIAAALTELKAAQAQEAAMMANILAAAEAATATGAVAGTVKPKQTKSGRQTKTTQPQQEEKKKMSWRPLVAVVLIAAILMIAAVAMQFGSSVEDGTAANIDGNKDGVTVTTPEVPTPDPNATPEATATPEPSFIPQEQLVITPATPSPIPEQLVTIDTSRYNVVKADLSWSTAADNAKAAGYGLATINDQNEFQGLAGLADKHGLKYVWVGGFRKSGEIVWISGGTTDYFPWAPGEPSYRDSNGASEYFLMMVKNADGTWGYNDVVDDPAAAYPGIYSGNMGYIIEK